MTTNFNIHITKNQYYYYRYLNIFLHILNYVLIFGIAFINILYVHYFIVFVHICICGFLMIKFNRFIKGGITINQYEKKIIYSVSFILLTNIIIYEFGISLDIDKIKSYIDEWKYKLFGIKQNAQSKENKQNEEPNENIFGLPIKIETPHVVSK